MDNALQLTSRVYRIRKTISHSLGLANSTDFIIKRLYVWIRGKFFTKNLEILDALNFILKERLKEIQNAVDNYSNDVLEEVSNRMVNFLHYQVAGNIKNANSILNKFGKTRRGFRTLKSNFSSYSNFSKAHEYLRFAFSGACHATLYLKSNENSGEEDLSFKRCFDRPELPRFFISYDGNSSSPEHKIRGKILNAANSGGQRDIPLCGRNFAVVGMGGVGKSTFLRSLCNDEGIQQAFVDGIIFLEFGPNSSADTVHKQLERCIERFGGVEVAHTMRKCSSLSVATDLASQWMANKLVLLLCDDMWPIGADDFGYIPHLKKFLINSPKSVMVASTRSRKFARRFFASEEIKTLEPHSSRSSDILGTAAFGQDFKETVDRHELREYMDRILSMCSGLPLALSMVGRSIRTEVEENGDPERSVLIQLKHLESESLPDDSREGTWDYGYEMTHVVKASLSHCKRWSHGAGKDLNLEEYFIQLCIFKKRALIPKAILSSLWGLSESGTEKVANKFCDYSLLSKEYCRKGKSIANYGVRLHDVISLISLEMAGSRKTLFHYKLLKDYIDFQFPSKIIYNYKNRNLSEQDSEFIIESLSRHLAESERFESLSLLLSDFDWIDYRIARSGWDSLLQDFQYLFSKVREDEYQGVRMIQQAIHLNLQYFWGDKQQLLVHILGYFSIEQRKQKFVSLFLRGLVQKSSLPYLIPLQSCFGLRDKRELFTINIGSSVEYIDVSRMTNRVVVATSDSIFVWCLENQKELISFKFNCTCVAVNNDATMIATGSLNGTIQMWDASNGKRLGEPFNGHRSSVTCIAISADSKLVISGSNDCSIRRWNLLNSEQIGDPMIGHEDSVTKLLLSVDNTKIVSGSSDGSIRLWDLKSGDSLGKPMCGHYGSVWSLAVSMDMKLLVSGSDDKTIRRWCLETKKQIGNPLKGHRQVVSSLLINSSGSTIVSGSYDQTIRLWNVRTGQQIASPIRGHKNMITCLSSSSHGISFMSGSHDHTIRMWGLSNEAQVRKGFKNSRRIFNCQIISSGARLIVSARSDNSLQRWDAQTGVKIGKPMRGHVNSIESVSINTRNNLIASGSADGTVRLWNGLTGEQIGSPLCGHDQTVSALAFRPNDDLLVSGSSDCTILRWDTQSGTLIGVPLRGHSKSITSLVLSPDGEMIISGSLDCTVRRWNFKTGVQVGEPMKSEDSVTCLSISGDGKIIAVGSADGTIRMWDVKVGKPVCDTLCEHSNQIENVYLNSDGSKMISKSSDRIVRIYEWEMRTALHQACITANAVKGVSNKGSLRIKSSRHFTLPPTSEHFAAEIETGLVSIVFDDGLLATFKIADDMFQNNLLAN